MYTTLDPGAQRLAQQLLAGRAGAVVALNPQNGAIKAMYANPGYNDNNAGGAEGAERSDAFDRALQGRYPPGSTFKVVTAAAALDTGRATPTSTFNGNSPQTVSGVPLQNDGNASYGQVTLTDALTYSINTVFGPGRGHARAPDDGDVHEAVRLLLACRRSTSRPARCSRAASARRTGKLLPPDRARTGRHRPDVDRTGQAAR